MTNVWQYVCRTFKLLVKWKTQKTNIQRNKQVANKPTRSLSAMLCIARFLRRNPWCVTPMLSSDAQPLCTHTAYYSHDKLVSWPVWSTCVYLHWTNQHLQTNSMTPPPLHCPSHISPKPRQAAVSLISLCFGIWSILLHCIYEYSQLSSVNYHISSNRSQVSNTSRVSNKSRGVGGLTLLFS